jgi:site-specific recombinase XerD
MFNSLRSQNKYSIINEEEPSPIRLSEFAYKSIQRMDVSEGTKRDYFNGLSVFFEFLKTAEFDVNSFLNFKRSLASRTDLSTSTKNKYLISAKILLRELHRVGILKVDITNNVKGFSQSKIHKKVGFSDQDIISIFAYSQSIEEQSKSSRVQALLSLFVFQGLRQIEIARLNIEDIDLGKGVAFIHGKGRDDKELIYLHPETIKRIRIYLKKWRLKSGALFVSSSNNNNKRRISTKSIRSIIKEVLNELEIENSVHSFRHFFTTKLVREYKGDLLKVSQFTRHRSIETLQIYYDDIIRRDDLPKFYETFKGLNFDKS